MLEKLFARNRLQKRDPEENGSWRKIAEGDYQRYMFYEELFRKIVATEAALHNMEDPTEIAIGVMKAACDLYEGDWSGILIADLHSQLWRPEIWYDIHTGPMTETLFHEFEMTEEYLTWVKHLKEQEPLVIKDVEAIRESSPGEYAAYQRLETHAVIGVPFGQHPLGFMVVRNPKKNVEQYEPLQIACFVAMMMLEQKRRLEAEQRFLISEGEEDDGKPRIRYNILGQHFMEIDGRAIHEQNLKHPNRRGWVMLLYLMLHKKPVDFSVMARDLWPDEEDAQAKNNNRQAIFRIHQDLAYHHDAKIIDTRAGVYMISEDVHITTDADEMEKLYEQTKHMPDTKVKLETLKKAFGLYRGRLLEAGEADMGSWMIPFTSAYNQMFVDITKELLSILGHQKDYHCLIDYGSKAIRLEPGLQDAYYWVIVAAENIGNSATREMCLATAKQELTEEEYDKLTHLLSASKMVDTAISAGQSQG